VHVTLRVVAGLPSLRVGALFSQVRTALAEGQERFALRLVHFSVQSNHVHLIVEAGGRRSLSRGMQGLSIRVARAVNGGLARMTTEPIITPGHDAWPRFESASSKVTAR
jgi:REP element-mobilizing transposase RayT